MREIPTKTLSWGQVPNEPGGCQHETWRWDPAHWKSRSSPPSISPECQNHAVPWVAGLPSRGWDWDSFVLYISRSLERFWTYQRSKGWGCYPWHSSVWETSCFSSAWSGRTVWSCRRSRGLPWNSWRRDSSAPAVWCLILQTCLARATPRCAVARPGIGCERVYNSCFWWLRSWLADVMWL